MAELIHIHSLSTESYCCFDIQAFYLHESLNEYLNQLHFIITHFSYYRIDHFIVYIIQVCVLKLTSFIGSLLLFPYSNEQMVLFDTPLFSLKKKKKKSGTKQKGSRLSNSKVI